MDMRLRLPELYKARGLTPYRVAKMSGDRISISTAYRLARLRGRLDTYKNSMIEALCDVLDVEPSELFERDKPKRR